MSSVVSRSFPSFSAPSYVTGAQQKLGSRRTLFSQTDAMSIANKAPRALYGARLYGKPSALTLASPDSAFLHNRVRDVARKETVQASPKRPASQTPQARLVGPSVFDPLKFNFVHHDCQTNALDGKLRKFVVSHDDKTSVITVDVAPNLHSLGQKIKHPDAVIGGWITQNDQIHALFMRVRLEWGWHQFLSTPLCFTQLRAWIFKKEMAVVLQAVQRAEQSLVEEHPDLQNVPVWIKLASDSSPAHDMLLCLGPYHLAARIARLVLDEKPPFYPQLFAAIDRFYDWAAVFFGEEGPKVLTETRDQFFLFIAEKGIPLACPVDLKQQVASASAQLGILGEAVCEATGFGSDLGHSN